MARENSLKGIDRLIDVWYTLTTIYIAVEQGGILVAVGRNITGPHVARKAGKCWDEVCGNNIEVGEQYWATRVYPRGWRRRFCRKSEAERHWIAYDSGLPLREITSVVDLRKLGDIVVMLRQGRVALKWHVATTACTTDYILINDHKMTYHQAEEGELYYPHGKKVVIECPSTTTEIEL